MGEKILSWQWFPFEDKFMIMIDWLIGFICFRGWRGDGRGGEGRAGGNGY